MQAVKEEEEEKRDKFELIKTLNEAWTKKFDNHFEMLQVFTNVEMYKHMKEMDKVKGLREEINEDNFLDEWESLMSVIPETYIVDEGPSVLDQMISKADPELEEMLTGWVESSRNYKE